MKIKLLKTWSANERAFSMVQILIAASIMGGLALFFAQMMANQAKQQKSATVLSEITGLESSINSILKNDIQCTVNFQSHNAGDEIENGLKLNKSDSKYTIPFDTPIGNIEIESMTLGDAPDEISSDGRGMMTVTVVYDKEANLDENNDRRTTLGPRKVTKEYTFFAVIAEQDSLGADPENGTFCSTTKEDALLACQSSMDTEVSGQSGCESLYTASDDCVCDDDADYAYYVANTDTESTDTQCWRFLILYNLGGTSPIAKCDNTSE